MDTTQLRALVMQLQGRVAALESMAGIEPTLPAPAPAQPHRRPPAMFHVPPPPAASVLKTPPANPLLVGPGEDDHENPSIDAPGGVDPSRA